MKKLLFIILIICFIQTLSFAQFVIKEVYLTVDSIKNIKDGYIIYAKDNNGADYKIFTKKKKVLFKKNKIKIKVNNTYKFRLKRIDINNLPIYPPRHFIIRVKSTVLWTNGKDKIDDIPYFLENARGLYIIKNKN